ncbi:MAG: branched-chain amino acid ABC transporter permease [Rhodospirillales bacterium]|nr:branched-chain amino acid ABC transporter permease [Rhodospirillales bacterium]
MTLDIALWLSQDAITNGAIYALLAIALVLVYSVTRIIFVPQGEFISFAALSLASLQAGAVPGTVYLLIAGGALVVVADSVGLPPRMALRQLPGCIGRTMLVPLAAGGLAWLSASRPDNLLLQIVTILAIVTPMGPIVYRLAFQPVADASVLVLLFVAVAVHYVLTGMGLVFFGGEGLRSRPFSTLSFRLGILNVSAQSLLIVLASLALIAALWFLFERTLYGKALHATAINRLGAQLVGVSPRFSGQLSFALAAFIAAVSGLLIAPITTVYYDTGFLISLKGFVGATIGGMASYPLAAVGALLVGFLEAGSSFWWSAFKDSIVFTLIVPVLLWRSLAAPHDDRDDGQ